MHILVQNLGVVRKESARGTHLEIHGSLLNFERLNVLGKLLGFVIRADYQSNLRMRHWRDP